MTKVPLPPIDVGTVINDRYEVLKSIGKGGMGEVFLAFDRLTQQQVALKVVPEASAMPGDDEALRQEVILAQKARHPNVCRVHDLAASPWGPILVMEYIPGQTLHNHIRKRKSAGGFTADEFRMISTDVCAGLAAIHQQGLVHGDLKPGNVMVAEDRAVILDFGFAKERARAAVRKPGTLCQCSRAPSRIPSLSSRSAYTLPKQSSSTALPQRLTGTTSPMSRSSRATLRTSRSATLATPRSTA